MSITSKGLTATLACEENASKEIRKVNRGLDKGGSNRLTDLGLLCDKGMQRVH